MAETGEQLELPFDELISVEEEINWENLPHYDKPSTDNEALMELQYQFRAKGDLKALDKMYRIGCEVAIKYLQEFAKKYKHMRFWTLFHKRDVAHQSVCYIIQSYLRKKNWALTGSWTGYLYRCCKKFCLPQRKVDGIVDFVDINEFYKEYEKKLGLDDDEL